MRLAILTPFAEPVKGGISSYVRELAVAYRGLGNEVTVYAVRGELTSGVEILGPSRLQYCVRVVPRLLIQKPTVVHAHSHWYILLAGLLTKVARPRTRVIFTIHTPVTLARRSLRSSAFRLVLRVCNGVAFVSKDMERALSLPCTVPQATVYAAPETLAIQSKQMPRSPSQEFSILTITPFVWPQKVDGLKVLVRSVAMLGSESANWRLVVLGDGPLRPDVEHEVSRLGIQSSVTFKGSVENVFDEIAMADVYAHISFLEGLPLSLLNAMAMGKAVLATRVGGIPEVIEHGITGCLVEPSAEAISIMLARLGEDAQLRRKLGDAARLWVTEKLSWERVARAHLNLAGVGVA